MTDGKAKNGSRKKARQGLHARETAVMVQLRELLRCLTRHDSTIGLQGSLLQQNTRQVQTGADSTVHGCAGMYADLDYEAIRNMDDLLQGHEVYLADMNSDLNFKGDDVGVSQLVPNAWMASVPRHPFWLICLQRIIRNTGYLEGYMDAESDMNK